MTLGWPGGLRQKVRHRIVDLEVRNSAKQERIFLDVNGSNVCEAMHAFNGIIIVHSMLA